MPVVCYRNCTILLSESDIYYLNFALISISASAYDNNCKLRALNLYYQVLQFWRNDYGGEKAACGW